MLPKTQIILLSAFLGNYYRNSQLEFLVHRRVALVAAASPPIDKENNVHTVLVIAFGFLFTWVQALDATAGDGLYV